MIVGGIETGGTTCVALLGRPDGTVLAEREVPTGAPEATLDALCGLLADPPDGLPRPAAVGIAAFGPIDLGDGTLLATPKPGWSRFPLARRVAERLGVPVALDTDVGAAARAEGAWGACRGLGDHAYVTVGTGVGVGLVAGGRSVRGLPHPELGHVAVPRRAGDDAPGVCPFHPACLEGFVSGPALAARFGAAPADLRGADRERARELTAHYLAAGLRAVVYATAPRRIVLGGGVSRMPGLHAQVRARLLHELGGYPGIPEHATPDFVCPPGLGERSGALGALVVACDLLGGTAGAAPPG